MKTRNAGHGKMFTFHGSFTSLLAARKKEARTPGSFIEKKNDRYYVLKPKKVRSLNKPGEKYTARSGARARGTARTRNPGKAVLIYRDITRIEGTKGKDSLYPGEKFFHNFKKPYPSMYGLPDGSLLIKGKK